MPLKFVTVNDNVFQVLEDFVPQTLYRGSAPGHRWVTSVPRLCSSKISLKNPLESRRGSVCFSLSGEISVPRQAENYSLNCAKHTRTIIHKKNSRTVEQRSGMTGSKRSKLAPGASPETGSTAQLFSTVS